MVTNISGANGIFPKVPALSEAESETYFERVVKIQPKNTRDIKMKTLTPSAQHLLLTGMFAICAVLNAQTTTSPTYTTASLQGTFVLSENGLNQQAQARYAAVAVLTLDGAGNVTGIENVVAGAFSGMGNTVTGTYSVSPIGLGSLALVITASDGSTASANYAILLTSQGVMVERSDNGILATAQMALQSAGNFSSAGMSGSFVLQENGYLPGGPFYLLGGLTTDGQGNVTGTATYQDLGLSYTSPVTGTYTVNPDGSGNLVLALTATAADGTTSPVTFTYALWMIKATGTTLAMSMDPGTTAVASISVR